MAVNNLRLQMGRTLGKKSYEILEQVYNNYALSLLCRWNDYLQERGKAVITVTGITDLLALKLGESRSKLTIFIDYLQYTREGLRDFPFPVVLWLTNAIHDQIAQQGVDFYSWRKGVFFFTAPTTTIVEPKPQLTKLEPNFADIEQKGIGMLKVEDLQTLIAQKKGESDQSLATLYQSLGQAHEQRLDTGHSKDYQGDVNKAITAYQKAIEIEEVLNLELDLANSLNNLAGLYKSQGHYGEAEPLYVRSLAILQATLGNDHFNVSTSLNNLARLYELQGRYGEAESLYLRSLAIREKQLGENHPDTATSLNNLARLYESQGRYKDAENLAQRAFKIYKTTLGNDHRYTLKVEQASCLWVRTPVG